jgi:uncharacterized coiled-coil protein SlyX
MKLANTPGQKLARLKELATGAAENYFERIALAHELLLDKLWIDAEHGGDANQAADILEEQYFHDLCGLLSVWNLIHVYQKFPTLEQWRRHKYNLRVMYDKCRADTASKKPAAAKPKTPVEKKVEELRETVTTKDAEIRELRKQIGELQQENRKLRKKLEAIEKILPGREEAA